MTHITQQTSFVSRYLIPVTLCCALFLYFLWSTRLSVFWIKKDNRTEIFLFADPERMVIADSQFFQFRTEQLTVHRNLGSDSWWILFKIQWNRDFSCVRPECLCLWEKSVILHGILTSSLRAAAWMSGESYFTNIWIINKNSFREISSLVLMLLKKGTIQFHFKT